jgi:Glycosyltransferase family 87
VSRADLGKRWWSAAAPVVMLLCAAWYGYDSFFEKIPHNTLSDFRWYYLAAQHVLHGESPYLSAGYIYSPFLACLLAPLASLNYVPAFWVWFLASHACLLWAAWLIWRYLGSDRLAGCVVALVWALGAAAGESLALGQIGPELTLLLAAAYTLQGRGQAVCAGAGFALKVIPGALCAIFALRRDFRSILRAAVTAFLLTALPWAFVAACLSGPSTPARADYLTGTPSVVSWSLPSVALRIYEPFYVDEPMPQDWITGNGLEDLKLSRQQQIVSLGVSLITLVTGCLILAIRVRGRLDAGQVPLASAAVIALALAASPVCWTHYEVMQYPGVALLLTHAARRKLWWLLAAVAVSAAFLYPVPVDVLRAYYERINAWPNSPWVMYFWTSVPAVASLALFGLMTRQVAKCAERSPKPELLTLR